MSELRTKILLRSDTSANWALDTEATQAAKSGANAVLLKGEMGIELLDGGLTKIKIGDGVTPWKSLKYFSGEMPEIPSANVYEVDDYSKLPGDAAKGDTGIVKALIYTGATEADNKYSYTGYVFNGSSWVAMDGNYDADNVYFDSNLVMTANIGVQTLGTASSKNLNTEGKSLKQVLSMILAKEEKPTITSQPTVTTKIGNGASSTPHQSNNITVEGGSTITPKWSASLSAGTYKYGPASSISASAWDVKGYIGSEVVSGHTATEDAGTFDDVVLGAGETYKVIATATHGDGPLAHTNLGEEYKAGNTLFDETSGATVVQIKGGDSNKKSDTSPTITAWQQGYYIGTLESDVEITSDILRNTGSGSGVLKNRTVKNNNYAAATDLPFSPSGTMAKFVVAYPAAKDMTSGEYDSGKGLASFFNNSSFEEYFGNFSRSVVKVAGADNDLTSKHAVDYAVWTWAPASAFTGTINFLIDLK